MRGDKDMGNKPVLRRVGEYTNVRGACTNEGCADEGVAIDVNMHVSHLEDVDGSYVVEDQCTTCMKTMVMEATEHHEAHQMVMRYEVSRRTDATRTRGASVGGAPVSVSFGETNMQDDNQQKEDSVTGVERAEPENVDPEQVYRLQAQMRREMNRLIQQRERDEHNIRMAQRQRQETVEELEVVVAALSGLEIARKVVERDHKDEAMSGLGKLFG